MKKPRKYERKNLSYNLKVYDSVNDQLLGHLGNITPAGIMVFGENPVGTDVSMELRITFPHAVEGREYLDVGARSVWVKKDALPELYDIGFELLDESAHHKQYIEMLVREFGIEEQQS
jgi:hypothetical protein